MKTMTKEEVLSILQPFDLFYSDTGILSGWRMVLPEDKYVNLNDGGTGLLKYFYKHENNWDIDKVVFFKDVHSADYAHFLCNKKESNISKYIVDVEENSRAIELKNIIENITKELEKTKIQLSEYK